MATMNKSTVGELTEIARQEGWTVGKLEARAGNLDELAASFSGDELRRLLVIWRESDDLGSRPLYRLPSPVHRPVAEPARAGDVLGGELPDDSDDLAAASADRLLPAQVRGRAVSGPPPGWRGKVARRWYSGQAECPWWIWGSTFREVQAWIVRGSRSDDPTEKAFAGALLASVSRPGGGIDREKWRDLSGVVALGFLLWFLQASTRRKGYHGCIVGAPRGLLAALSAQRFRGVPVAADTISRKLAKLGEISGPVLEWHQPAFRDAARFGLPRSIHWLADGRHSGQAINVYWFRRLAKTAEGPILRSRVSVSDLAAGYEDRYGSISSPGTAGGKEYRRSGGTGPPDVPSGSS